MTYEWEDLVTAETLQEIQDLLPEGLVALGVAVVSTENMEAALIQSGHVLQGISQLDALKDIYGDAATQYIAAVQAFQDGFTPVSVH